MAKPPPPDLRSAPPQADRQDGAASPYLALAQHAAKIRLSRFVLRSVLIGLALAALMAGVEVWAPFDASAQGFQDFLHRLPLGREREAQVLTIELGELGAPDAAAMGPLVDRIASSAPKALIISATPAEIDAVVAACRRHPAIPLLAGIVYAPASDDLTRFEPAQEPPPPGLSWGARVLPVPSLGVNRTQLWRIRTAEGFRPTLEGRLASEVLKHTHQGEGFRVDFRDLQNRLPRVEAGRVLRGEIPSNLAEGRVVWVARTTGRTVVTPIDGSRWPIQDLDFHAACFDTVLRRAPVVDLPWSIRFLLMALAGGLFYRFLRKHDAGRAAAAVLLGGLGQGLLAWLLLAFPGWLWPALPLIACQFLGVLVAQMDRMAEHRELLRIMVLDSGRHLPSHLEPTQAEKVEDYWQAVGSFLDQFLKVNRSVFLVRAPGAPRVQASWAFHCELSGITEQRRDYRRDPYAQAIRADGPLLLKERLLLQPEPGERQFLVPLIAFGSVEGFWAVALPAEPASAEVEAALKPFALQLAEMLHSRRSRVATVKTRSLREEYFASLSSWAAIRTLERHTGELDRNYQILGALYEHLSMPTLIFDLFGRMIRKNASGIALLARRGIPAEQISLLDVLGTLFRTSPQEVQVALRMALLHRESQTFRSDESASATLRATLRPLILSDEPVDRPIEQALRPFGLEGLVLEIEDIPTPQPATREIQAALDQGGAPPDHPMRKEFPGLATTPEDGLGRIAAWTREIEHEQSRETLGSDLPDAADAGPALGMALEEVHELLLSRRIGVDQEGAVADLGDVLAAPRDLPEVLGSILYALGEDAQKGSRIRISWQKQPGLLVLSFRNQGHGLPGETLQTILTRPETLDVPSLRGLVASARLVEIWGGKLEAVSTFGQGMEVHLRLLRLSLEV